MAVLSVDLAFRRWTDLGIVVLDRVALLHNPCNRAEPGLRLQPLFSPSVESAQLPIACEIIPSIALDADVRLPARWTPISWPAGSTISAPVRGIRVMMLDGPQAWKSRSNGLDHARVSERQLNTAAKTGLPGMVKPITYRPFAEFCLDVYDALCRRGWRRLETRDQPGSLDRIGTRTRRELPLRCLEVPGHQTAALQAPGEGKRPGRGLWRPALLIPITTNRPPNHDQLQAIVGGLPGLALEEHNAAGARIVGNPPRREEGHWREGFIVLPLPPPRPIGLRWLH